MKVLFTFGGIPHYLNAMLNRLQAKGIEITVVSPQKGNTTIGKGVKMVEGGAYKHLTTPEKKLFYGKSAFPALPEIIAEEKPDIVVVGWPYFLQVFFQPALRKAIKSCNARLVIREIPFQTPPYGKIREYFKANPMHDEGMRLLSKGTGFYLRQWVTTQIRKYCYAKAAGTLNYSTAAYDILPSYGVKKEQIHVTYNSTDTDALLKEKESVLASPSILPPCDRRLLHIGRLVKWKRVYLLIEAFRKVAADYPEAELVIVGDGPELDRLKQKASDLQLADRIRFIGAVYDPKMLGAYMNESSIYVLAGMGGLSINDAMTYGMPVLCAVCDSTERDLVMEGRNGYFFKDGAIAYFSMEYGLDEVLKIYSGGLGMLAGDYLKEASDSNVDLCAIGLLYRYGYFDQSLSMYGQQTVNYKAQNFGQLPIEKVMQPDGKQLVIHVPYADSFVVHANVWKASVGRIPLYLLDTDNELNSEFDRPITHHLYGGDWENRLKQEILLGIGGMITLRALGITKDVYHCNEGHAALINIQRLCDYINGGLNFGQAMELVRASSLYTVHTPVPAGHDYFDEGLFNKYMKGYPGKLGITWDNLMDLGRHNPGDKEERFCMSVFACKTCQEVNGVSKLHKSVSQQMFAPIWKGYFPEENHVGYVTNGVHLPTWCGRMEKAFQGQF